MDHVNASGGAEIRAALPALPPEVLTKKHADIGEDLVKRIVDLLGTKPKLTSYGATGGAYQENETASFRVSELVEIRVSITFHKT